MYHADSISNCPNHQIKNFVSQLSKLKKIHMNDAKISLIKFLCKCVNRCGICGSGDGLLVERLLHRSVGLGSFLLISFVGCGRAVARLLQRVEHGQVQVRVRPCQYRARVLYPTRSDTCFVQNKFLSIHKSCQRILGVSPQNLISYNIIISYSYSTHNSLDSLTLQEKRPQSDHRNGRVRRIAMGTGVLSVLGVGRLLFRHLEGRQVDRKGRCYSILFD